PELPTEADLVRSLLREFPIPIRWAYPGAYFHLVGEVVELLPHLRQHAKQKVSEPFFLSLARLTAVLLEDIEHADPDDASAEAASAAHGIAQVASVFGLKRCPDSSDDWSFAASLYEQARNWDVSAVASLLRSRWCWQPEPCPKGHCDTN